MKKKVIALLVTLAVSATSIIPVFAGTKSSTLEYKGSKATAKLDVDFSWKIITSDKATATTSFTNNPNNYRVAVRLERWDTSSTMGDYKYNSDAQIAQCNYTWTDVHAFQSRHSIDNSTNTIEYAVDSFNEKE